MPDRKPIEASWQRARLFIKRFLPGLTERGLLNCNNADKGTTLPEECLPYELQQTAQFIEPCVLSKNRNSYCIRLPSPVGDPNGGSIGNVYIVFRVFNKDETDEYVDWEVTRTHP